MNSTEHKKLTFLEIIILLKVIVVTVPRNVHPNTTKLAISEQAWVAITIKRNNSNLDVEY